MQPRELRSLGVRALGNPIADFVRFRCCSSGSLKALLSRDRLRIIAGRPPAGLLSLSAQEAPRRIRTRGCSWYHLISQLTLPLYAAPTSDSSVTAPVSKSQLRSYFRISVSEPVLQPGKHLPFSRKMHSLNRSLCRSVEAYSSSSMPLSMNMRLLYRRPRPLSRGTFRVVIDRQLPPRKIHHILSRYPSCLVSFNLTAVSDGKRVEIRRPIFYIGKVIH